MPCYGFLMSKKLNLTPPEPERISLYIDARMQNRYWGSRYKYAYYFARMTAGFLGEQEGVGQRWEELERSKQERIAMRYTDRSCTVVNSSIIYSTYDALG